MVDEFAEAANCGAGGAEVRVEGMNRIRQSCDELVSSVTEVSSQRLMMRKMLMETVGCDGRNRGASGGRVG